MRHFQTPLFIVPLTAVFLIFAVAGCGSSAASTKHLDKYDHLPYRDAFTLDASKETVYRAAIHALQQQGYVITLSDPQTGLINAELNSSQVLSEELKAAQPQESSGTSVFWTIIGIIFLFGLIAMIVGSSESDDRQDDRRNRDHSTEITVEDSKTISFRYIVTLKTSPVDESSSEVRITAVRMRLENGGVVESGRMENKYLNYGIADLIEDTLRR